MERDPHLCYDVITSLGLFLKGETDHERKETR